MLRRFLFPMGLNRCYIFLCLLSIKWDLLSLFTVGFSVCSVYLIILKPFYYDRIARDVGSIPTRRYSFLSFDASKEQIIIYYDLYYSYQCGFMVLTLLRDYRIIQLLSLKRQFRFHLIFITRELPWRVKGLSCRSPRKKMWSFFGTKSEISNL